MGFISFHSPVGDLSIAENDNLIVSIDWGWGSLEEKTPLLEEAKNQIAAYFNGKLKKFDLPILPLGTAYQQQVWEFLQTIPFGTTKSYSELAKIIGGSARSIGNANAANPIPIIIPCHRVIGKHTLGGYSGGEGIKTKEYLLNIEKLFSIPQSISL